jgi:pSer/pThr/pTyr-binding forkhead associated (FHA) protein
MTIQLTVRSEDTSPEPIAFDMPRVVLGRGPNSDVLLPDPSVSHRHASVRQRGGEYIVLDEGSTNGTFVGPVRLSPGAPRVLRDGDLIRLGRVWVEVGLTHVMPTSNPADLTKANALQLVSAALAAEGGENAHPRVTVQRGPDAGTQLLLKGLHVTYTVGRAKSCNLVLTDEDISREHVEITHREDGFHVKELGSKNGITLGDRRIAAGGEASWTANQPLRLGQSILQLHDPAWQVLSELTQGPDEIVAEEIEPPQATDPTQRSTPDKPSGRPSEHSRPPAPVPSRASWSMVDVLVALLAVLVLAASAAGLMWLVKS